MGHIARMINAYKNKCSAESPKRKRALGILTWEHNTKIYLKKKSMADNILVRARISGAIKYNTHCGCNVPSDCAKYRHFHDEFERQLFPQETLLHRINYLISLLDRNFLTCNRTNHANL